MKFYFIIFLFYYVTPGFSQIIYTSPLTIHFPSGEIEYIDRVITFDIKDVIISTETDNGKDIQRLIVKELEQRDYLNVGICDFIICTSTDGIYETHLILPTTSKVEFIDIIQPPQYGQLSQHYRFLVD